MNEDFPDWLKRQFSRRDWTQADAARAIGVSSGRVSEWVNGKRPPSVESLERIADALHIDVETVLRKAGHLPEVETVDEFAEEIMGLVKRIHWTPERVAIIRGSLQGMLRTDADARK